MPGGKKGHTYLTKTAAKRSRLIKVCVTFCYHEILKGSVHVVYF